MLSPSVRHKALSVVSDLEYQNLPKYLKLMTLHNLNQAIHNINTFMADYSGTGIHTQHQLISSGHLGIVDFCLWTSTNSEQNHNLCMNLMGCPLVPSAGEKTEFQMEELQRLVNAGTKTPVIILCLTELKRLTHVGGVKNSAVYKLNTEN